MDDLISREAAVDAIQHAFDRETLLNSFVRKVAVDALKTMPSVKPQTGHWIKTISENGVTSAVRCSECGFEDNRYMLFRYCPDCGAKLSEIPTGSESEE